MARIAGIDIPDNKQVLFALTYIYGIGRSRAQKILSAAKVDPATKVKDLSEEQLTKIRNQVSKYKIEGDLRRDVALDIKLLMEIACYRGIRHRRSLPVRGQRTRQNARMRKGPRKTVANKKKATK